MTWCTQSDLGVFGSYIRSANNEYVVYAPEEHDSDEEFI